MLNIKAKVADHRLKTSNIRKMSINVNPIKSNLSEKETLKLLKLKVLIKFSL